jgi:hypothetical protein
MHLRHEILCWILCGKQKKEAHKRHAACMKNTEGWLWSFRIYLEIKVAWLVHECYKIVQFVASVTYVKFI